MRKNLPFLTGLGEKNLPFLTVLRIRIKKRTQGAKINQKLQKKNVQSQYPNLNYWKKRDYLNFMISEWFIKKIILKK